MSRRFRNPNPEHRPRNLLEVFRWGVLDRLTGRRRKGPPGPPAPRVEVDRDRLRERGGPARFTWLGHASFQLVLAGCRVLVDPVVSRWLGIYRRHDEPPLPAAALPRPDLLLVTHNHYDHLDEPVVRALPRSTPVAVPLGLGRWFRRRGFSAVRELGWWDSTEAGTVRATLVPARHWSRRGIADVNRTLWGGFVIESPEGSVYHAGDSAWFDGFAEIGQRFPNLAAALLPAGGYAPAWFMEHNHMNPEQAGRAFLALGARRLVPMHWGSYQLTDEPLVEPPARLETWWRAEGPDDGRRCDVLSVGETRDLWKADD